MEFIPFKEATTTLNGETYIVCQLEHHILRQRRLEMNMTQAQVAERANILLRQYARIEGQPGVLRSSGARILLSVCAVLKLDPYMFFPEIPDNAQQKNTARQLKEPDVVVLPSARTSRYIPLEEYMDLMRRIPAGFVVTVKTVEAYFQKKYDVEVVVIENHGRFTHEIQMDFPFWRELSANGQLYATTRFKSQEQQKELLEKDGLEIVPCGPRMASLKVKDYKKHLFNLESLIGK